jgi:hypothetical protein
VRRKRRTQRAGTPRFAHRHNWRAQHTKAHRDVLLSRATAHARHKSARRHVLRADIKDRRPAQGCRAARRRTCRPRFFVCQRTTSVSSARRRDKPSQRNGETSVRIGCRPLLLTGRGVTRLHCACWVKDMSPARAREVSQKHRGAAGRSGRYCTSESGSCGRITTSRRERLDC